MEQMECESIIDDHDRDFKVTTVKWVDLLDSNFTRRHAVDVYNFPRVCHLIWYKTSIPKFAPRKNDAIYLVPSIFFWHLLPTGQLTDTKAACKVLWNEYISSTCSWESRADQRYLLNRQA